MRAIRAGSMRGCFAGSSEEAQWVVQIVQEIIAIAEQKDARNAIQDQEI